MYLFVTYNLIAVIFFNFGIDNNTHWSTYLLWTVVFFFNLFFLIQEIKKVGNE